MKKNMGTTDRWIRLFVAVILFTLYFTKTVTGTTGIVLLVIGGVFVLTSLVGLCPLYSVLGIKTCSVKKQQAG